MHGIIRVYLKGGIRNDRYLVLAVISHLFDHGDRSDDPWLCHVQGFVQIEDAISY